MRNHDHHGAGADHDHNDGHGAAHHDHHFYADGRPNYHDEQGGPYHVVAWLPRVSAGFCFTCGERDTHAHDCHG